MTICAIKVCRNYKGRLKTTKKVTYHRIPKDPILRSKWIEIIRESRGEDLWQPSKTAVICSDHFRAKDLYFANNQSRQRLKKEAIPCKALFLTSLETDDDESNSLIEETGRKSDCVTNVFDDAKILVSNEDGSLRATKNNQYASSCCMETSNINVSNFTGIESASASSHIPGQATDSKIGDGRKKENESDIIDDFSDLESIFDTPKKIKLRQELRRRIRCINATVSSLRKDDDDEEESENIANNFNEHEGSKFQLLDDSQLSEYTQQIVGYIAGFVVRCLRKQVKCVACIESLISNKPLQYHKLVNMRDEGGLIYASHDVYHVCKTAESVIRKFIKQDFIMTPINYAKIVSTVMKQFVGGTNYFEVKTDHVCGLLHQVNLIRLVVEKYLDLRYYYKTKLDNNNRDVTSKRKLFKKQIQREGH
ncbi:unnamed protein product [Parnassius apollo]|uniref:(apollo) hypothetical protein n=1 Tax=Parnassius apollo TaxID=110799 RepID=A0A8S3WKK8_PARAO|nr:unnamed protein product [Parnassius apollo]